MASSSRRATFPVLRPRLRNQREAGICVERNSWPGRAVMQSTRPASTMFLHSPPTGSTT